MKQLANEAEKMRQEKDQLSKALTSENDLVKDKMNSEIEEKKRQQQGLESILKKNEEEKNEILQLYENMRSENNARKKEKYDFRDLLNKEKEILFNDFSRGTSEVKDLVEKEKLDINKKTRRPKKTLNIGRKWLVQTN